MAEETTVAFVARSEVRTAVLRALVPDPRSAAALIDTLAISRSGVYKALNSLANRDLVAHTEDGTWRVTGAGRLVADELRRHDWVASLLADRDYWRTHDLSGLPDRFRRRLPELRSAELLENPDGRPRYLEQRWMEVMPEADRLWVGSRIAHGRYAEAMDEQATSGLETRLVTDPPLVEEYRPGYRSYVRDRPDAVAERVCGLPCSFMLTEELFTLSLPLLDGRYDQDTVLVGEDEPALRFGEDFVTYYWERATPVETYLDETGG